TQVARRLGQKPAHERRAAISREERRRGLGSDLGWQVGLPAHIWKVGAHQVEFARERLEQVTFDQMYAAGEAVLVDVSLRHVERVAADVPRPDFHGRSVMGERDGDAAAAGADVRGAHGAAALARYR